MSTVKYDWRVKPPAEPGVYVTRRRESTYLTNRYWDGHRWFEIAYGDSRGGVPFTWPKGSGIRLPRWLQQYKTHLFLRTIRLHQDKIQWGDPYKHYEPAEVMKWLVHSGRLVGDWKERYQNQMRHEVAVKGWKP